LCDTPIIAIPVVSSYSFETLLAAFLLLWRETCSRAFNCRRSQMRDAALFNGVGDRSYGPA
jgi:hypothetical protein